MLNSNYYNFSNPGLDADIGDSYFSNMYPNAGYLNQNDYIPGVTGTMNGITINGQLSADTYERGRKSRMSPLAKIALGIIAVGGIFLGVKGLKNGAVKLWEKIKGIFKKKN